MGLKVVVEKNEVRLFDEKYFRRYSEPENSVRRKGSSASHLPARNAPHRDYERDQLSFNLVEALKGHIPLT